jgi:MFS family permease
MPRLLLAYLAFLGISSPDGLLGVSWPSMSVSFGQPVGALGLMLPFAVASSMLSSASTGALLTRIGLGRILACSIGLYAVALLAQSLAPVFWVFIVAAVVLAAGSGAIDAALNAFAAQQFNARQITWLHAVYGLGAAAGPLLFVATAEVGLSWRWAFALVAAMLAVVIVVFACTVRLWQIPQQPQPRASKQPRRRSKVRLPAAIWSGASLFAVQTGVESGTALWAYLFLTDARAVPPGVAAATASGYWMALVVGRVVLGPVAMRIGPHRASGLPGRDGAGCGAAALAWTRARRWHRVAGAFRCTDVPAVNPHHEGPRRRRLGRSRHRCAERSFGCRISDPAGADRTVHRLVRVAGDRALPAGTRPDKCRCIRLEHVQS